MEEDLLKRHTDCVYFLASPLTCKKGADCEYRHSKIARLNPKDCWYWLSGNCLNPTCAFRHPPLDGHGGTPSEPAPCSVSENMTNVPCYFYFNGFCNKGDRCSFLHDIDASTSTGQSSKTASASTEALPAENKTTTGNNTVLAPTLTHPYSSETASKTAVDTRFQPKEDLNYLEQPALGDVPQKSASPQVSVSGDEEASEIRSDSLPPEEGFIDSKSQLCTDQSSEEQSDDLIVSEEWLESSPGFDVLVDDKSGNLSCEDDLEYFMTLDGERRELNSHFLGYDFENPDECDPMCPDAELLYEREIYDSFGCLDNKHIFGSDRKITGHTKENMLDSMFSHKRKLMPIELAVDDHDCLDLRDHLRSRRVIDGGPFTGLSRRHESLRWIGRRRERPQRHGMDWRLHGRLASEVGKSTYGSLRGNGASFNSGIRQGSLRENAAPFSGGIRQGSPRENAASFNGGIRCGSLRHSQQYRSRKHPKERRVAKQQIPSSGRVSRKPVLRVKRSTHESTTFTGPKTLAQIKEEKRKAEVNGGGIEIMGHVSRAGVDFQGPKPLNEILKEKRKLADKWEGSAGGN